jgi:hypothetical protein
MSAGVGWTVKSPPGDLGRVARGAGAPRARVADRLVRGGAAGGMSADLTVSLSVRGQIEFSYYFQLPNVWHETCS